MNNDRQILRNEPIVNSTGREPQDDRMVSSGVQISYGGRTVTNGAQSIPANHKVNSNRVIIEMITEAGKQFQMRNQNL